MFVSIHLIPALHVLDMYECLGFKGEKDLLLARYYIYCCKFKNISPSISEYAQQLKYNLEIEKQTSIPLLIPKINSSRSGTKCFMHYNLRHSLRAGSKCKPARRLYTLPLGVSRSKGKQGTRPRWESNPRPPD